MSLWRPKKVAQVIAKRELAFRLGKKSRVVIVKIGRAVRQPKASDGDPWWTPLEIRGLSGVDSMSIAGVDSLQSLVLALRFLDSTLPAEARRLGGRVDWLGERSRPILGPSRLPHATTTASKRALKRGAG